MDPVLKNTGVPSPFKSILLEIKKTEKIASGVKFANETKHGKFKSTNFKSWIPKSTVFDVSPRVPSIEDFPLLAGVRTKKCVPKEILRKQELPTKKGAVLVRAPAQIPVPLLSW